MVKFYKNRNKEIINIINEIDNKKIEKIEKIILNTKKNKGKIIICGNGGSSATASHFAVDLSLNAKIQSVNFNEYDLITCFANDFGYENWVKKSLEIYATKKDLLILLSCSGNSKNLVNANLFAKKKKLKVVTLTGCKKNNKLNSLKNNVNLWINSNKYNVIEITHHMILLNIIDSLMKVKY
tara:strand:- start:3303 stop:3848 length:546 start_codon:yes stop_codon:yes gene_type:complete